MSLSNTEEWSVCQWTHIINGQFVRFYVFNSRLSFNSVVVQDWYQSVPVGSTPTPDPYPHPNGGQTLGTHRSCPTFRYINMLQ